MIKNSIYISVILGIFFPLLCLAQNASKGIIRGQVRDNTGEPIAYATVLMRGANHGAVTDNKGNFELTSSSGNKAQSDTIEVSFEIGRAHV